MTALDPWRRLAVLTPQSEPEPTTPALWIDSEAWEEASIPERPWIARGYLLRGAVTALSGIGSGGKSSVIVTWSCSLALGMPASETGFKPHDGKPHKVLIYNVEDDMHEQRRRFSAALRQFGATPASLAGRVLRCGPSTVGTLVSRDPLTGSLESTRAMQAIEALIERKRPDVFIADPFVELHDAEENDNTAVRGVVAWFRSLAARFNMAVLVLHHDRKGDATPGDPDRLRGASAIVGACRVVLTLTRMSQKEADDFGQPEGHRKLFFRIDGAKANYSAAQDAEWYELVIHELDNGEHVPAATAWAPPNVTVTPEIITAAIEALRIGKHGEPCTEGNRSPAFYRIAFRDAGIPDGRAHEVLQTLKTNNLACLKMWRDPESRKFRERIWVSGNGFDGWKDDALHG